MRKGIKKWGEGWFIAYDELRVYQNRKYGACVFLFRKVGKLQHMKLICSEKVSSLEDWDYSYKKFPWAQ